jgi:hypothetical protein
VKYITYDYLYADISPANFTVPNLPANSLCYLVRPNLYV